MKWAHAWADALFFRYRFPGSRKLARLLSRLLLPPLRRPAPVSTRLGFELMVHPRWDTDVYYLGFYERGTLAVMKACLRAGDCFIDVGAHVGLMSLFAAQCVGTQGKVLAFEPVAELYDLLCQSISRNGFNQVHPFRYALGAQAERKLIFLTGSCPSLIAPEDVQEAEWIDVQPLDALLRESELPVRMMKMDVEGYELAVVQGARRLLSSDDAPVLCLEFNRAGQPPDTDPLAVFRLLQSWQDYRFFQLQKGKSTPSVLVAREPEHFQENDNVFAFTGRTLQTIPASLFE